MPDRDSFEDRKRGQEEEYFRKKEQELIERMRLHAGLQAERQQLAEAIGVADETILKDLQELGYTRDTVPLLHLVPLLQVAWAEGKVSRSERELILEVARARGIEEGSAAYQKLTDWMSRRPPDQFFHRTLRIIGAVLHALPPEQEESSRRDLVSYCTRIAEASGGILGLGQKIDPAERALLQKIAGTLERKHESAAREVLEED